MGLAYLGVRASNLRSRCTTHDIHSNGRHSRDTPLREPVEQVVHLYTLGARARSSRKRYSDLQDPCASIVQVRSQLCGLLKHSQRVILRSTKIKYAIPVLLGEFRVSKFGLFTSLSCRSAVWINLECRQVAKRAQDCTTHGVAADIICRRLYNGLGHGVGILPSKGFIPPEKAD